MTTLAPNRYAGYRFPPEIIDHTVRLYFRFPLSLRMVEEMLAASRARLRRLPWHYRLGKPFGVERLEAAATRALEIGARTYGLVKSILENNLDRQAVH